KTPKPTLHYLANPNCISGRRAEAAENSTCPRDPNPLIARQRRASVNNVGTHLLKLSDRIKISRESKENTPMYQELMVIPMREELTRLGIEELRTSEAVDRALKSRPG